MSFRSYGPCAAALLLFASACDPDFTEPYREFEVDRGKFSILVERRGPVGQRSFYTIFPQGNRVAPFAGIPIDGRNPTPSPDGTTIAFVRFQSEAAHLWLMDRDGANLRPLVQGERMVTTIAWSPDGRQLVFDSTSPEASSDIWVINADGTGARNLTPDPLPAVYFDRAPSWSPDGRSIAVASNRSGGTRLWIMNTDGTNPRAVVPASITATERTASWSPDAKLIASQATTGAGDGITVVAPDGSSYRHYPLPAGANGPIWLPDGRLIFSANPAGNYDLFVLDRATGVATALTSRRDHDVQAVVLPAAAPFAWLGLQAPAAHHNQRPGTLGVVAGDFIADGLADIATLIPSFEEIRLLLGISSTSWAPIGSLTAPTDLTMLASGRITTDLVPDIVAAGATSIRLWRGSTSGPGLGERHELGGEVRGLAVADFDGDNRDDIATVVARPGQGFHLMIHTIRPDDVLIHVVDVATTVTGAGQLCAGDIDGDGWQDLVILAGTSRTGAVLLMRGHGDIGFDAPVVMAAGLEGRAQARPYCADLTNDGRDDIVLFLPDQLQGIKAMESKGTSVGDLYMPAIATPALAIADMDRDDDLDLVVAVGSSVHVFGNLGNGRFSITPRVEPLAGSQKHLLAMDITGDFWPDVVMVDALGSVFIAPSRGR